MDRPIEAREGSSVRLECRADGIPTPIIRWRTPVRTIFSFSFLFSVLWYIFLFYFMVELQAVFAFTP